MHTAIFGAGAVGGYFGGRLAQAGQEVTLIARGDHLRPCNAMASASRASRATSPSILSVPPTIYPPSAMSTPSSWPSKPAKYPKPR